MLAFVHMHKCAGTTVVKSAQKSGFRMPTHHRNGNLLVEPDGKTLRYDGIDRAALDRLIDRLEADGTEFFALEMDFPPAQFLRERGIDIFTVIRDPLVRAISNFRYAKNRGNVKPDVPFRKFLNNDFAKDGPLSRASDYYTRKLCQLPSTAPMSGEHLDQALAALAQFRAVIVLEQGRLEDELKALGFGRFKASRRTDQLRSRVELTEADLAVSDADRDWFIANNPLDIALYERMQRVAAPSPAA